MDITVLGAGTMGHGIAQVSAMAGHEVTIRDLETDRVEDGLQSIREHLDEGVDLGKVDPDSVEPTLNRIRGTTDLADAVAGTDMVVEAVHEDLELKQDVFTEVEELIGQDTIVATNTSSISVTAIASALDAPERSIGLHFFNPPHIMPLVEIIVAEQTDDKITEVSVEYVEGIEKDPVVVQDAPGFVTSRLGEVLGVESMRMLQEGIARAPDIDQAMRLGYNYPMGPLELSDHVGLDVRLGVMENLVEEIGERFRPPPILRRKVRAGKLGKKTGEGFYVWDSDEIVGPSDGNPR
jgi:3-hydroxybutyryl-CoA dehydrogenase